MVKNPPTNGEDTGSTPDAGRAPVPQSNAACVHATAPEALEPALRGERRQPAGVRPRAATRERPVRQPRPSTAKHKQNIKKKIK